MTTLDDRPSTWTAACPVQRLVPGRGVAVLRPDGSQAAVFLLCDGALHAVGNVDPFSGAAVLSRGLVGDRRGEPTVASPLLKQVFSLRTGRCLDDGSRGVAVHEVRVEDGVVLVGPPRDDAARAAVA
jgi:nitrite reductase (NADH) small subunit